jgi:DHA1 family inner membrane transport protein
MKSGIDPRVYILTFTAFVMLSSEFIVAGLLPEISSSLHISLGHAGGLVTAFALGMGVSSPLLALYTQEVSLRRLMILACVALLVGNVLSSVTQAYEWLLLGRFIGGVGVAIFWTNSGLCAVALSRGRNEHVAMSRVLIGISIASVVGVPMGKWVATYFDWMAAMWLMAVASLVALISVVLWVKPHETPRTRQPFLALARKAWEPEIRYCLISCVLIFAGISCLFNYLAALLGGPSQFTASSVTVLLALYGVADIAGNLIWVRWLGRDLEPVFKWILRGLFLGLIAVSATAGLDWAIPAAIVTVAFCHAGVSLTMGIDILRRAGNAAQVINAINVSMVNIGIVAGASFGGWMANTLGVVYVGYLGAAFIALAYGVRLWMPASANDTVDQSGSQPVVNTP